PKFPPGLRIQLDRLGNPHRPPPGRLEYAGAIKFHDLARTTLASKSPAFFVLFGSGRPALQPFP
ncbi:MAG: hypothetical protein ABIN08_23500, partial [Caldimonas sp.]